MCTRYTSLCICLCISTVCVMAYSICICTLIVMPVHYVRLFILFIYSSGLIAIFVLYLWFTLCICLFCIFVLHYVSVCSVYSVDSLELTSIIHVNYFCSYSYIHRVQFCILFLFALLCRSCYILVVLDQVEHVLDLFLF